MFKYCLSRKKVVKTNVPVERQKGVTPLELAKQQLCGFLFTTVEKHDKI